MKYDKLVRDRIPEIIKNKGKTPVTHIAKEKEYWQKLLDKLKEEVDEFHKDDSKEEFADILEVIEAIGHYKKYDKKEILEIKKFKQAKRGGFKKKIILEQVKG